MHTPPSVTTRLGTRTRRPGLTVFAVGAIVMASLAGVSAHFVRGLASHGVAAAFVSSPTSGSDAPIRVMWGGLDTGLRVACFYVANSSAPRVDRPGWPRVTAVGFELPGSPTGFSLLSPLDGDWEIQENVATVLAGHEVTLDVAIVARVNPTGRTPGRPQNPRGIPPGQAEARGSGTPFCVSGPFPATTIEGIIDGVVVGFHGVEGSAHGTDAGVWFPTLPGTSGPGPEPRLIPLF